MAVARSVVWLTLVNWRNPEAKKSLRIGRLRSYSILLPDLIFIAISIVVSALDYDVWKTTLDPSTLYLEYNNAFLRSDSVTVFARLYN